MHEMFLPINLKGYGHLEDVHVNEKDNIKMDPKKLDWRMRT
jgi:hypothetical protein